jgi:hypothetical protein
VSITITGWWQFARGERAGIATGWTSATKQCANAAAVASWASTPEGQLAYRLAQAGSLRELATCSGRGWTAKDGTCFAQPDHGRMHGWRLPSNPTVQ